MKPLTEAKKMCYEFNFIFTDAMNILGLDTDEACALAHWELSEAYHLAQDAGVWVRYPLPSTTVTTGTSVENIKREKWLRK